ncbi:unnamed protein product [Prorocentrum cordatum]|uniref:Uncharacterized protein n=1 Tax=Prorocentrum cordatum TaxID=2364126 RepID=A0ABN9TI51_9DINO|nr:unnamed protein product [Polarella glacialis]
MHLRSVLFLTYSLYCTSNYKTKLRSLIQKFKLMEKGHAAASTSADGAKLDDKVLRSCCQNAIAIRVVYTSDPYNHRLMKLIATFAKPLKDWQETQSKTLRSSQECCEWTVGQIIGDYMEHAIKILTLTGASSSTEACRVCVDGLALEPAILLEVEEDFTDTAGVLALGLATRRAARSLWLLEGWRHRMAGAIKDHTWRQLIVGDFRLDYHIFQELGRLGARPPPLQKMFKRSVFQLTPVAQCRIGLERSDWKATLPCINLVESHHQGIASALLSEEKFGIMKNRRVLKGAELHGKPEVAMAKRLEAQVGNDRNRYTAAQYDVSPVPATVRIPKDMLECSLKSASIQVKDTPSKKPAPEWHSPGAPNISTNVADLFALRHAHSRGDLKECETAWLGALPSHKQKLLVKARVGHEDRYFIGGLHFEASACLVWPVQKVEAPASGGAKGWYDVDATFGEARYVHSNDFVRSSGLCHSVPVALLDVAADELLQRRCYVGPRLAHHHQRRR